jgi:hypothetical protein
MKVQGDTGIVTFLSDVFVGGNLTVAGQTSQLNSDWEETNVDLVTYIRNKPTIPAAQVNSDWEETNVDLVTYIRNKPAPQWLNNSPSIYFNNNVGIGTNAPSQLLEVAGTVKAIKYTADTVATTSGNMLFFDKPAGATQPTTWRVKSITASADGLWLLISSIYSVDNKGAAHLYNWSSATNNFVYTQTFTNSDGGNPAGINNLPLFYSTMSQDGSTVVVYDNCFNMTAAGFVNASGRVKVYRRASTTVAFGTSPSFTFTLSAATYNDICVLGSWRHNVTADGTTITAGAPYYQGGFLNVYRWNNSSYVTQIIVSPFGATAGTNSAVNSSKVSPKTNTAQFGMFSAISSTGTWLAVFESAAKTDNCARVHMYTRANNQSNYALSASLKPYTTPYSTAAFGLLDSTIGLFMNDDGTIMTVPNNGRYLYVYTRTNNLWTISSSIDLGTGWATTAVSSMSQDGKYLIVRNATTSAIIYEWNTATRAYTSIQTILSPYLTNSASILCASINQVSSSATYELYCSGFLTNNRVTVYKPLLIRGFNDFFITSAANSIEVGGLISSPTLTGMIATFAGTRPPLGWLLCDGRAVSQTTYASLFNFVLYTYNATPPVGGFNLPRATTFTQNGIAIITCIKY